MSDSLLRLKNKTALVTGSASGIGEAIARKLAGEGARVIIHGRHVQRADAERIAAGINAEGHGEAAVETAMMENPEECAGLVEATVARFGGLDILVNNAAVITRSRLETTDAGTFDFVMAINLRAPLLLIRAAYPHFRKAGGGSVLNIGSVNAYCGEANLLAYSISKGGLMVLTRNLADAHAREGIRVNQINPGWVASQHEIDSQIAMGLEPGWHEKLPPEFAPSGRILKPEEIAHFALAFLSGDAPIVSGAVIELEQFPVIGRNPVKSGV